MIQPKLMRHTKNQVKTLSTKQSTESDSDTIQLLDLSEKLKINSDEPVISLAEKVNYMHDHMENFNRNVETIRNVQVEMKKKLDEKLFCQARQQT